jgi:hypothetical protein
MTDKDIKNYFHFDAIYSKAHLQKLATNDSEVASHAFMPLLRFREEWVKFRKNGTKKVKSRPIRYCCRRDAAILAYHRWRISQSYEDYLQNKGISDLPIAYRKMPKVGGGNKSNIEFAKDAFDTIRSLGNCDVTVVDISSFFESIDHQRLHSAWETIIGRPLDAAEEAVFKAVTQYSVVDIKPAFDRLKLFNRSGRSVSERKLRKIDKLKKAKHKRVVSLGEFESKICGGDASLPSLIQRHRKLHGIPQGTPISDILANIYLHEFDLRLARWVRKKGGRAFRYSDDVIVILPRNRGEDFDVAFNYLQNSIKNFGNELKIKKSKAAIGRFIQHSGGQIYTHIQGDACKNGIEYLGFQYDGKKVQLKDSTLSNAWRKLKKRSHGWAKSYVKRFRNKGDFALLSDAPIDSKVTETLRTLSMRQSVGSDVKEWTFISYVKRCSKAFEDYETRFNSQTKKYKKQTKKLYEDALVEAVKRHGSAAYIRSGGSL